MQKLFYKFLKNKDNKPIQVSVAVQSPNKLSKRVILDVNIPHTVESATGSDVDLPLRMRALLLLGLSQILDKKAQLLVNDCYRVQSVISDAMSLKSCDLPKEQIVANDMQITLNSGVGSRSVLDVDISFEQGDLVDRWIDSNFTGDRLLTDSLSGSINLSLNGENDIMDIETDMLQRYTQDSILDDLLPPSPNQSLLAQELNVETRRGDISDVDASLRFPLAQNREGLGSIADGQTIAPMEDSWDGAMDMDVEPLSGGDMPPPPSLLADKTILKPIDKSMLVPRQRKRRAVVLDKSLELPMTGVIVPRAKLQEALHSARSKRQKLNNMRIVLLNTIDTDQADGSSDTSNSYGMSLQELVRSRLLSGQTNLIKTTMMPIHAEVEEDSYGELPEMDIEPLSMEGPDEVTLQPIEPNSDMVEQSHLSVADHENLVDGEQLNELNGNDGNPQETVVEYDVFVREMKTTIEDRLVEEGERSVSWNAYTQSNNRHVAANKFFHLLTAATKRDLSVYQSSAYGDISVSTM